MKICLISDWYPPRIGGLELQMRDLAVELKRAGHEVEVVCSTPGPDELDGVRIHRMPESLLPVLKAVYKPSTVARLERLFVARGYDVVHCHTAFSPLAQFGALAAHRLAIPSVLTEHSVMKGAGARLLSVLDRVTPWTTWPDVMTAVSTYVAAELERVSHRKVEILPNGVRPEEWDLPSDDRGVLTVASVMRLRPRKRPLDVVRAIPLVHAQLPPSLRPRFVLVGDGPERAKVEREAQKLGVEPWLELAGWQPRPEVKKILARSSIFVLPTSKEALSIATLEALSAGLPSVAMNHGGVGDVLTHGREGFLARDFDDWVQHIVALCRDEALRHRMAQATREAAARFAWPRVLERHLEIYQLAIERRRGAASPSGRVAA
jgi:glycosyltransferase involved in cell wall biosynthesis